MLSNDIFAGQAENFKKIANHLYCLSALPQRKQFKTQVKQKMENHISDTLFFTWLALQSNFVATKKIIADISLHDLISPANYHRKWSEFP